MSDFERYKREADQIGVPVIPPLPPHSPWYIPEGPRDPNPVVAICGECGLHIHNVMGYSCSRPRCPTGLGSFSSRVDCVKV